MGLGVLVGGVFVFAVGAAGWVNWPSIFLIVVMMVCNKSFIVFTLFWLLLIGYALRYSFWLRKTKLFIAKL